MFVKHQKTVEDLWGTVLPPIQDSESAANKAVHELVQEHKKGLLDAEFDGATGHHRAMVDLFGSLIELEEHARGSAEFGSGKDADLASAANSTIGSSDTGSPDSIWLTVKKVKRSFGAASRQMLVLGPGNIHAGVSMKVNLVNNDFAMTFQWNAEPLWQQLQKTTRSISKSMKSAAKMAKSRLLSKVPGPTADLLHGLVLHGALAEVKKGDLIRKLAFSDVTTESIALGAKDGLDSLLGSDIKSNIKTSSAEDVFRALGEKIPTSRRLSNAGKDGLMKMFAQIRAVWSTYEKEIKSLASLTAELLESAANTATEIPDADDKKEDNQSEQTLKLLQQIALSPELQESLRAVAGGSDTFSWKKLAFAPVKVAWKQLMSETDIERIVEKAIDRLVDDGSGLLGDSVLPSKTASPHRELRGALRDLYNAIVKRIPPPAAELNQGGCKEWLLQQAVTPDMSDATTENDHKMLFSLKIHLKINPASMAANGGVPGVDVSFGVLTTRDFFPCLAQIADMDDVPDVKESSCGKAKLFGFEKAILSSAGFDRRTATPIGRGAPCELHSADLEMSDDVKGVMSAKFSPCHRVSCHYTVGAESLFTSPSIKGELVCGPLPAMVLCIATQLYKFISQSVSGDTKVPKKGAELHKAVAALPYATRNHMVTSVTKEGFGLCQLMVTSIIRWHLSNDEERSNSDEKNALRKAKKKVLTNPLNKSSLCEVFKDVKVKMVGPRPRVDTHWGSNECSDAIGPREVISMSEERSRESPYNFQFSPLERAHCPVRTPVELDVHLACKAYLVTQSLQHFFNALEADSQKCLNDYLLNAPPRRFYEALRKKYSDTFIAVKAATTCRSMFKELKDTLVGHDTSSDDESSRYFPVMSSGLPLSEADAAHWEYMYEENPNVVFKESPPSIPEKCHKCTSRTGMVWCDGKFCSAGDDDAGSCLERTSSKAHDIMTMSQGTFGQRIWSVSGRGDETPPVHRVATHGRECPTRSGLMGMRPCGDLWRGQLLSHPAFMRSDIDGMPAVRNYEIYNDYHMHCAYRQIASAILKSGSQKIWESGIFGLGQWMVPRKTTPEDRILLSLPDIWAQGNTGEKVMYTGNFVAKYDPGNFQKTLECKRMLYSGGTWEDLAPALSGSTPLDERACVPIEWRTGRSALLEGNLFEQEGRIVALCKACDLNMKDLTGNGILSTPNFIGFANSNLAKALVHPEKDGKNRSGSDSGGGGQLGVFRFIPGVGGPVSLPGELESCQQSDPDRGFAVKFYSLDQFSPLCARDHFGFNTLAQLVVERSDISTLKVFIIAAWNSIVLDEKYCAVPHRDSEESDTPYAGQMDLWQESMCEWQRTHNDVPVRVTDCTDIENQPSTVTAKRPLSRACTLTTAKAVEHWCQEFPSAIGLKDAKDGDDISLSQLIGDAVERKMARWLIGVASVREDSWSVPEIANMDVEIVASRWIRLFLRDSALLPLTGDVCIAGLTRSILFDTLKRVHQNRNDDGELDAQYETFWLRVWKALMDGMVALPRYLDSWSAERPFPTSLSDATSPVASKIFEILKETKETRKSPAPESVPSDHSHGDGPKWIVARVTRAVGIVSRALLRSSDGNRAEVLPLGRARSQKAMIDLLSAVENELAGFVDKDELLKIFDSSGLIKDMIWHNLGGVFAVLMTKSIISSSSVEALGDIYEETSEYELDRCPYCVQVLCKKEPQKCSELLYMFMKRRSAAAFASAFYSMRNFVPESGKRMLRSEGGAVGVENHSDGSCPLESLFAAAPPFQDGSDSDDDGDSSEPSVSGEPVNCEGCPESVDSVEFTERERFVQAAYDYARDNGCDEANADDTRLVRALLPDLNLICISTLNQPIQQPLYADRACSIVYRVRMRYYALKCLQGVNERCYDFDKVLDLNHMEKSYGAMHRTVEIITEEENLPDGPALVHSTSSVVMLDRALKKPVCMEFLNMLVRNMGLGVLQGKGSADLSRDFADGSRWNYIPTFESGKNVFHIAANENSLDLFDSATIFKWDFLSTHELHESNYQSNSHCRWRPGTCRAIGGMLEHKDELGRLPVSYCSSSECLKAIDKLYNLSGPETKDDKCTKLYGQHSGDNQGRYPIEHVYSSVRSNSGDDIGGLVKWAMQMPGSCFFHIKAGPLYFGRPLSCRLELELLRMTQECRQDSLAAEESTDEPSPGPINPDQCDTFDLDDPRDVE